MSVSKIIKIILAVLGAISAISIIFWVVNVMTNPTPENISQGGQLIADAITPWWIPVIQFLATFGVIGGIAIVALLYYLSKHRQL
jgi:hypothetical protein